MLPFATLSDLETAAEKAKYLADVRVEFLRERERKNSAPAQEFEISAKQVFGWCKA